MAKRPPQFGSHFLQTRKARTLSLTKIARMDEDEAYEAFVAVRFAANGGEPECPYCKCNGAYKYRTRKIFKCRKCLRQFSATSRKLFASRKVPYKTLLLAVAIFAKGQKGRNAIEMSHEMETDYKTAWALAHKLREAMKNCVDDKPLSGVVEIDGAEFGGYIKPKNVAKSRTDLRKIPYRSSKKLVVVVARERRGRARTIVVRHEAHAKPFIEETVSHRAELHADSGSWWDDLNVAYATFKRINHKQAYYTPESHTNNAENFFSILRRAERGTYHHIAHPTYFPAYCEESAWRQNLRNRDLGFRFDALLEAAATADRSRLAGYFQRRKGYRREARG